MTETRITFHLYQIYYWIRSQKKKILYGAIYPKDTLPLLALLIMEKKSDLYNEKSNMRNAVINVLLIVTYVKAMDACCFKKVASTIVKKDVATQTQSSSSQDRIKLTFEQEKQIRDQMIERSYNKYKSFTAPSLDNSPSIYDEHFKK
jgi:hypothetical protein